MTFTTGELMILHDALAQYVENCDGEASESALALLARLDAWRAEPAGPVVPEPPTSVLSGRLSRVPDTNPMGAKRDLCACGHARANHYNAHPGRLRHSDGAKPLKAPCHKLGKWDQRCQCKNFKPTGAREPRPAPEAEDLCVHGLKYCRHCRPEREEA